MFVYTRAANRIACLRLCRLISGDVAGARRARDVTTKSAPPRSAQTLSVARIAYCSAFRAIRGVAGAWVAHITSRNPRRGARLSCRDMRQHVLRCGRSASRRFHSATAGKAPVLLAGIFVVIGDTEREPLARQGTTRRESVFAVTRKVARDGDTRRRSETTHRSYLRDCTRRTTRHEDRMHGCSRQPVPPSLTRGACDGGVVAEKPANRASGWSQRYAELQAGRRGTLPRISVRRG